MTSSPDPYQYNCCGITSTSVNVCTLGPQPQANMYCESYGANSTFATALYSAVGYGNSSCNLGSQVNTSCGCGYSSYQPACMLPPSPPLPPTAVPPTPPRPPPKAVSNPTFSFPWCNCNVHVPLPYTVAFLGYFANPTPGFVGMNFTVQSAVVSQPFDLSKLVFPVSLKGWFSVNALQFNGTPLSASYDYYGSNAISFKVITSSHPLTYAAAARGVPLYFEVPDSLDFGSFFAMPQFAVFPNENTLCPVGFIATIGSPSSL